LTGSLLGIGHARTKSLIKPTPRWVAVATIDSKPAYVFGCWRDELQAEIGSSEIAAMFQEVNPDITITLMCVRMPPTDWGGDLVDRGSLPPEDLIDECLLDLEDVNTALICSRVGIEEIKKDMSSLDLGMKNRANKLVSSSKKLVKKLLHIQETLKNDN
tara:strand:+ start:314 stop:790 length:477 start_codon:yes stop_codon:yes gene_type:complete